MRLLDLFIAATVPVMKVLLVAILGSVLAMDAIDILGKDARRHLNEVVFYVFGPALIATNLAKTITFESMVELWFMPLNILITYIVGSALGLVVIRISKAPSNLKGLILGCCSAGNLGTLLLVIIPAICREKASPFGDPDVCHSHGMAYISLSMAIGAVYLWSYVYNIVRISASSSTKAKANICADSMKVSEENSILFDESYSEALIPSRIEENVPIFSRFKEHLMNFSGSINWRRLFAPSTIAAIVGFIVGVIPIIRRLLIGASSPLRVILDSASLLGDGSIPVLTLVLGGNLTKGLKGSGTWISFVIGVIVVKYLLMPLAGIFIVKGAIHFGLVTSDPLYQFVLLIHYAVPPALNIGTIAQLFGAGESEFSVIMLWTYALASVSLTLWSTYFMWLHMPSDLNGILPTAWPNYLWTRNFSYK